jgi:hypothetical protein
MPCPQHRSTFPTARKPLRLWPGIAAATLLVLAGYVTPIFMPQYAVFGMIGAAGCALIILLWWLLFSRARWYERVGAIVLMIAAVFAQSTSSIRRLPAAEWAI